MFGIGGLEIIIIVLIALVLFGAPVLTFLAGYSLGRKRAEALPACTEAIETTPSETSEEQHSDA